jgi:hypothetical protein
VTGQQTNTTTTTTRPLAHDEKHAIKGEREHQKKAAEKEIERQKDALDKARTNSTTTINRSLSAIPVPWRTQIARGPL